MDTAKIVEILNELLAAEQGCVVSHLLRSASVLSEQSVAGLEIVRRVEREVQEHGAWLAGMINSLDSSPGLRRADTCTAGMHYRELERALPALREDCVRLRDLCTKAAGQVAQYPRALTLVERIGARHELHARALAELIPNPESKAS